MVIIGDGRNEAGGRTRGRAEVRTSSAFPDAPAVVASRGNDVDFFTRVLADISGIDLAGDPIERKAPRITQAVREYFRPAVGNIDIDAKHLAELFVEILCAILRIIRGAAVAHTDVEKSIGTKLDHAAIVVLVRL